MSLASACAVLADTTALKASIVEFLLSLKLVLQLGDFGLLRLESLLEAALEFLFELCLLFLSARFPLLLLLFKIINLLLEHLDVQLELLLDLDMVTDLGLVVLQLLLILLRGQVKRLERAGELASRPIVYVETTWSKMLVLS